MRRLRRITPRRLGHDEEATLVEHLSELRHRLLIGLLAIVPAFLLAFAFRERLIEWLKEPLPPGKELVTLGVTEPFTTAVKVSMIAAVGITLPILLWQLWSFLAPAMGRATQRVISLFVVLATGLFASGVAFAYFIILPRAVEFLTNFDDSLYDIQIRASYYLTFTAMVLLATGLAFQMPIFILALVRIGVLSSAKLRRNRRLGIVLMLSFAILLPTVDPVSLAFEVVPLLILFEASIWLSVLMERRLASRPGWGDDWRDGWRDDGDGDDDGGPFDEDPGPVGSGADDEGEAGEGWEGEEWDEAAWNDDELELEEELEPVGEETETRAADDERDEPTRTW